MGRSPDDSFEPLGAERGIITKVEVEVTLERAIGVERGISHRGGPPDDKSDRVPPGRSCHSRRYNQGQEIIGNSRWSYQTQILESAPAAGYPLRKYAHRAPPQPSTSVLAKPRTDMINTSQHNLRRASESPG